MPVEKHSSTLSDRNGRFREHGAAALHRLYPESDDILKTQPLTASELALGCALSSTVFIAVEIEKFFKRRSSLARGQAAVR